MGRVWSATALVSGDAFLYQSFFSGYVLAAGHSGIVPYVEEKIAKVHRSRSGVW
jgi:hypothetical protein